MLAITAALALLIAAWLFLIITVCARKMRRGAKFSKVSLEQFTKDMQDTFSFEEMERTWETNGRELSRDQLMFNMRKMWEDIKLPERATMASAGYDFYAPFTFTLKPGETIKIPTGIRCEMPLWVFLLCLPRSGLGFKFRCQLDNTAGVIDPDYFYADNEGHIFAKITNDTKEEKGFMVRKGTAFMQGIFLPYLLTVDDESRERRTGGFGSTTK